MACTLRLPPHSPSRPWVQARVRLWKGSCRCRGRPWGRWRTHKTSGKVRLPLRCALGLLLLLLLC